MTPRETAVARDLIARARLEAAASEPRRGKAKEKDGPTRESRPAGARASKDASPALARVEGAAVRLGRYPRVYPIPGPASIMECPVHQLVVALDEQGRICSACPGCVREADVAIERMAAA